MEVMMKSKDLKKLLAGLGAAGLLSVGGIGLPNVLAGSSGWGDKPDAGSVGQEKEANGGDGTVTPDPGSSMENGDQSHEDGDATNGDDQKKDEGDNTGNKDAGKSGWN